MNFEEWKAEYSKGKYRVQERDLEVAWNAAINEAVNLVMQNEADLDSHNSMVTASDVAKAIKALKQT